MPLSETVLVLMLLLGVGVVAAGLFRDLPVPYTVLLVVIGMALGNASGVWPALEVLHHFRLTPELVLFIFLPALIFESGLNLDARQLLADLGPVLVLAVPALLFSTFAVGLGLWLLLPVEPATAFLFGALISATDPVAVIALFKELGAPQRLTVLVEGESLMNDATAIVVFKILLGIAVAGTFHWGQVGGAAGEFLEVFLGGALVGVAGGLLCGALMTRLQVGAPGVIILSLVLGYVAFVVAEHTLHLSGVMAVAAAALALGGFALPRLPQATVHALRETWEFLAMVANTLLFLLVGLAVDLGGLVGRLDAIAVAVVLVLAARASMVYSLVPVTVRAFGLPRVTRGDRHIMWWGGLKGGLAIAIALSVPESLPGRQLILDLTLGVVLFTLLVNAPTIRPLIRRLGIDRLSGDERAELGRAVALVQHRAGGVCERLSARGLLSRGGAHQARREVTAALPEPGEEVTEEQRRRRYRLQTLRAEQEALEGLYREGMIPQYTFLDLKGELHRKRDHVLAGTLGGGRGPRGRREANPFLRLEDLVLARLREHDWAAGLLARLQNRRTAQHLVRDIAHILMADAARGFLDRDETMGRPEREELKAFYDERIRFITRQVAQVRADHPEFYRRFEARFALRAALARALEALEREHDHGGISPKPFGILHRRLERALAELGPVHRPVPELDTVTLLGMVPLLSGLPPGDLAAVARHARTVSFLTGDVVIAQGETGDALYVVARGNLTVTRRGDDGTEEPMAVMGNGDFFGETALLGDHRRTATVTALTPCTLVRLTRAEVLGIADHHPEVAARLEHARRERLAADGLHG